MKKILVIDNFDSFTFNLVDYFKQLGAQVEVYRNTITLEKVKELAPHALVFSPGPSIPTEAGNMLKIIKGLAGELPMLGICLGHEAFIEAFGGKLHFVKPVHGESSPIKHDGKTIFKNIKQNFPAGRYHSLAAKEIPKSFEISATSKGIIMGIRHMHLPIEGVQFHPESVLTMNGAAGFHLLKNFFNFYVKHQTL